jgi:alkanesulfonate monooxygenase SsuD/methylene tetrahydromethanopterin reductase-like flavin-dependent oxidoreductase (luciferase family)
MMDFGVLALAQINATGLARQAALITPRLIEAFCISGTEDACLQQVHTLQSQGIDQVMILPSAPDNIARDIDDFSRAVISKI